MKDAYTFDRDAEGLDVAYEKHVGAYDRMCDRCGLEWYRVEADVGMMGGTARTSTWRRVRPARTRSRSRLVTPPTSRSRAPTPSPSRCRPPLDAPQRSSRRPGMTTIDAVAGALGAAGRRAAEGLSGRASTAASCRSWSCAATTASTRSSCATALGAEFRPAHPARDRGADRAARVSSARSGRAAGPARRGGRAAAALRDRRQPPRRAPARASSPAATSPFETVDVRSVVAGDTVNGSPIRIEPAIEVGNIFKLGTRYSEPLGATYSTSTAASS